MITFVREFEGHKYSITISNNRRLITAKSTFAGEPVIGVAKCNPKDVRDDQIGIKLAILRCAEKIARKRYKKTFATVKKMEKQIDELQIECEMHQRHLGSDTLTWQDMSDRINRLLTEINEKPINPIKKFLNFFIK